MNRIRNSKKKKPVVDQGDVMDVMEKFGFQKGMELVYAFGKMFDIKEVPLAALIQAGNIKIPKETAIFNMSSATDCASLALGLCKACVWSEELQKLKTVCYALKAEREYRPAVLPYRRRQEKFWKDVTAESFAMQFLIINSRKGVKFDKIRLNEAGDFHTQECVDKAEAIARGLKKFGIRVYCYTARRDLDFSKVRNLVISGSNFAKDGVRGMFKMVHSIKDKPKGYGICKGDCRVCQKCLIGRKTVILRH